MRPIALGVCTLVMAACSSSSRGSSSGVTVTGTIDGHPVATTSALGVLLTQTVDKVTSTSAGVTIMSLPATCDAVIGGSDVADQTILFVAAGVEGSTLPPGQYTISPSNPYVGASYGTANASCFETTAQYATSGTITISVAGGGIIQGDFDVTFPTGETLTGTFSVPICIDPNTQPDAAPECGS